MIHRFELRVYYEDTDLAGIVYYANYLKFIERARSELVRALGIEQTALRRDLGMVFAVREVSATYFAPARFDDCLEVRTTVSGVTGARIMLAQDVWRGQRHLFQGKITLVCLTSGGRGGRIPADIRRKLTETMD